MNIALIRRVIDETRDIRALHDNQSAVEGSFNYLDGRLADLNQWGTVIEIAIIALFSILIIYCKWVVHNMCVYSTVCSALLDSSASPHTPSSSISAPL